MKVRVQNPTTAIQYVEARVIRNGESVDTKYAIPARSIQTLTGEAFFDLDAAGLRFTTRPQLRVLSVEGLEQTNTQEAAQKVADATSRPLASEASTSTSSNDPKVDVVVGKPSKH